METSAAQKSSWPASGDRLSKLPPTFPVVALLVPYSFDTGHVLEFDAKNWRHRNGLPPPVTTSYALFNPSQHQP
jgi:hypothetical protein